MAEALVETYQCFFFILQKDERSFNDKKLYPIEVKLPPTLS